MKPRANNLFSWSVSAAVFIALTLGCGSSESVETGFQDNLGLHGVIQFGVWENLHDDDLNLNIYAIDLDHRVVRLEAKKHSSDIRNLQVPPGFNSSSGKTSPNGIYTTDWQTLEANGDELVRLSTKSQQFAGGFRPPGSGKVISVVWSRDSSALAALSEESKGCRTFWRFVTHDAQCHDFFISLYSIDSRLSVSFPLKRNVPGVGVAYLQWP